MQGNVAGLHDGAHGHGKRLPALVALAHAQLGAFALQAVYALGFATTWANRTIWPDARFNKRQRGGFVVEMIGGKQGLSHGTNLRGIYA